MIICYLQEKYNIFHYNFTFVLFFLLSLQND